ncbi:4-(cytidine 5'-diphospho)-2-C-methyl-D-erythritol kinase [Terrarubrum flagellatum]|uniref:4-(cytidine 5'-diphospho)-2-C-methyl-D-erythritol kinase n=1 Tax=Terrirubrum flagellatum TaxID=2895980 RepID=UPI00314517CF
MLHERAPAKINLSLRVVGRRADGYHLLDSLVVFASDVFDELSLTPGEGLSLAVEGPLATDAGDPSGNLVLKAARALMERCEGIKVGAFRLAKRLPVAAGLGGGSADAAAALRLLARLNDIALDHPDLFEAARATGADVPVCLQSRARMMRGIGDELGPILPPPNIRALLVNPRVACPTASVFRELNLAPGDLRKRADDASAGANENLLDWLAARPNDLEAPAIRLAPVIADVLETLRALDGCALARMSGSGATCFGLFDARDVAEQAASALRGARPDWWIATTKLM